MTAGMICAIAALCVLSVVYAFGFLHGRESEQKRHLRFSKPNPNDTETEDRYYE